MAFSTSTAAMTALPDEPKPKETKRKRTTLTSPFFTDDTRIKNIYKGTDTIPVGYIRAIPPGETKPQLYINPKPTPEMFACQRALYIVMLDIDREWVRDGHTTMIKSSSSLMKRKFTGILDSDTASIIAQVQASLGIVDYDAKIGKITLEKMDERLELIRYYNSSNTPFIYHAHYICENGETFLQTRAYRNDTYLYMVPVIPEFEESDPQSEKDEKRKRYVKKKSNGSLIHLVQRQTKIVVMHDVSAYSDGWYYVKVLIHQPNGSPYFEDGYIPKSHFLPSLRSMPDPEALLIEIDANSSIHRSVYDIVRTYYYVNTFSLYSPENERNVPLVTQPVLDSNGDYDPNEEDNESYAYFKFYVNLLLYANNPNGVNAADQSIYLKDKPDTNNELIDSLNPRIRYTDDGEWETKSNYLYFLKLMKELNSSAHWDWDANNDNAYSQIVVKDGYNLWVPSRHFADRLYAILNTDNEYLGQIASDLAATLREWPRGLGVGLSGSIAATFAIPVRGEIAGGTYLSRKHTPNNDVVLVLRKEGKLGVGASLEASAGLKVSSGRMKNFTDAVPAGLGGQVSVGGSGSFNLECEFEFPLSLELDQNWYETNEYVIWPLLMTLATFGTNPMELLAYEFLKSFADYNINPMSYLTKLNITNDAEISVGGSAGFSLGWDEGEDLWDESEDPGKDKNPWSVRNLLALMNLQLGGNITGNFALGFNYEAEYGDDPFNPYIDWRVPEKFTLSVVTTAGLISSTSANVANIFSNYSGTESELGLELTLSYNNPLYFTDYYSRNYLDNLGNPKINIISTSNEWNYFGSKYAKCTISLDYFSLTDLNSTSSTEEIANAIDGITLTKRIQTTKIGLTGSFSTPLKKNGKTLQKVTKSLSSDSETYIEIDFILTGEGLTVAKTEITKCLDAVIAKLQFEQENFFRFDLYGQFANLEAGNPATNIGKAVVNARNEISKHFQIDAVNMHGEWSYGVGVSFKVAALAKIGIELNAAVQFFTDQKFMEDGNWIVISPDADDLDRKKIKKYLDGPGVLKAIIKK